jgi:hypothetical protein
MNSEFSETFLNSNVKVSHRIVSLVVALKQYLSSLDIISLLRKIRYEQLVVHTNTRAGGGIPLRAPDVPPMLRVDRRWAGNNQLPDACEKADARRDSLAQELKCESEGDSTNKVVMRSFSSSL